jgi:hypothetical protein
VTCGSWGFLHDNRQDRAAAPAPFGSPQDLADRVGVVLVAVQGVLERLEPDDPG